MSDARPDGPSTASNSTTWIVAALAVMVIASVAAYVGLSRPLPPPPADVAGDSLLKAGREIYLSRCISCHGEKGRGDGPIAKSLAGPKPRDFAGEEWKHGDRPEQALAVVNKGVAGTTMSGWASSYSPQEIRAVTAYVYYLAGKPVPEAFRSAP